MLQTKLCKIKLKNPTVLASGILGVTKETANRIGKIGAGAVTLKSLCHEERFGNSNPTMFGHKDVFLNAVGLPGQGIDSALKDFKRLDNLSVPVIGSIYGYKIEQFGEVAKKMASLKPSMIEVDVSCPHMDYGKPYYADTELIAKVTKTVKDNTGKIPVSIKLSPNVHDIKEIAHAAERAGADAITAINTATGMVIDIDAKKPILHNKIGGVSGPALKPIAVRCVYEIYETVKIPIIGTGGVTYGKDALEMIMAGATAVGVGTGVFYRGIDIFKKVCNEMEKWMKNNKIRNLDQIRGIAHK
ncbi:dihydroorotate dehydrogenase B catalytic subunit [Candidatus Woesearchaeota archaeon]|jgi:dihydroorotate dehydrogenase (NAD+) catalytic subunit|nr:dihydroorotate dehydrogenase B catalytic subunit [Candidatus Woesearchaeota archaeon]MDP6648427.1 dihydroorotate dehydrogenase [Candidatus Woesearchaeota archaeon]|tara:strand:- start:30742 stop:31644 length:903 start_codon:yes stop_codon:yes gene_type:complete